jgi:hypothetical protein
MFHFLGLAMEHVAPAVGLLQTHLERWNSSFQAEEMPNENMNFLSVCSVKLQEAYLETTPQMIAVASGVVGGSFTY